MADVTVHPKALSNIRLDSLLEAFLCVKPILSPKIYLFGGLFFKNQNLPFLALIFFKNQNLPFLALIF